MIIIVVSECDDHSNLVARSATFVSSIYLLSPLFTLLVAAEVVSNVLLNEEWQRLWSDESSSWVDALRQLSTELYRWWQVRSRLLYLWMYAVYTHYVDGTIISKTE